MVTKTDPIKVNKPVGKTSLADLPLRKMEHETVFKQYVDVIHL